MVNIYDDSETLPNVEPTEEHDTILARIRNGIREFDELLSDIQNNVYTVDDKVDTCTMLGKLNQILEYVKGLGILSIAIDDNNQIVFTLKNGETITTQPIQSGTNISIDGSYVTSLSFDSNPQQQLDTQNTQITNITNRLNTHDTMIGDIDDELNTQQSSINNLASNIQSINDRKINSKTFNGDITLYGTDVPLASDNTTTVTNAVDNLNTKTQIYITAFNSGAISNCQGSPARDYGWYRIYSNGFFEFGGIIGSLANITGDVRLMTPYGLPSNSIMDSVVLTAIGADQRTIIVADTGSLPSSSNGVWIHRRNSSTGATTSTHFTYMGTGHIPNYQPN